MPKGKKNVYICDKCGRKVVTKDLDDGVTPFMVSCREFGKDCDGVTRSCFYSVDQTLPVNYVWFKPVTLDDYEGAMLEHIEQGGLDLRKATPTEMFVGSLDGDEVEE